MAHKFLGTKVFSRFQKSRMLYDTNIYKYHTFALKHSDNGLHKRANVNLWHWGHWLYPKTFLTFALLKKPRRYWIRDMLLGGVKAPPYQ